MFRKPSLVTRIVVGKSIGFVLGIVGFFTLPYVWPDASLELRLGALFWYATVGAVIGVFGVWSRHPVLDLPLPWFVRAPLVGAWMNFVLTLFAGDVFRAMLGRMFGPESAFASPYWIVLEGAVVGALIGWAATRFGGEGPETARG
mgnify:CR=1 FL=1